MFFDNFKEEWRTEVDARLTIERHNTELAAVIDRLRGERDRWMKLAEAKPSDDRNLEKEVGQLRAELRIQAHTHEALLKAQGENAEKVIQQLQAALQAKGLSDVRLV